MGACSLVHLCKQEVGPVSGLSEHVQTLLRCHASDHLTCALKVGAPGSSMQREAPQTCRPADCQLPLPLSAGWRAQR